MKNPLLDLDARVVIAHRGNRAWAPENTIAALHQAVSIGADALEFDVRVTRDGVAVVIHDSDIDRTTDGRGLVESFTFDELSRFDASARSPFATGSPMAVPSLEEVLDRFREIPLVIEVKEVGAIDATARLVRQFGAQDRIVLGSAVTPVAERLYELGFNTCASIRDAMRLIPIGLAGLRPARPKYQVLSVTPRFRGFRIPIARMAAAARKVGIPTQVWTVNDRVLARSLWHAGVTGIVTDDPAAMLRAREG